MSHPLAVDRAISLTQPWAQLMAIDAKRIETRGWATNFRGWIAIHASKNFPRDCKTLCFREPFASLLAGATTANPSDLPLGCVVAVTELYDCVRTDSLVAEFNATPQVRTAEWDFGNYSPGRFGFLTRGVRRLREPIPVKGALGIWRLPRPITEEDLL